VIVVGGEVDEEHRGRGDDRLHVLAGGAAPRRQGEPRVAAVGRQPVMTTFVSLTKPGRLSAEIAMLPRNECWL